MEALIQDNLSLLAVTVVLLPLISFLAILLIPGKSDRGGLVAIFSIGLSVLMSIILFVSIWNKEVIHAQVKWFTIGQATFNVGILLNNLSVIMLLLVSVIALLVHIYSTQYMKGDRFPTVCSPKKTLNSNLAI